MSLEFDVVIVGAGAAGLFCAARAGQRGLKVLLIDHSERVAEKIRISGGGRCNFTNQDLDAQAPQRHFVGANPQFARSALQRYMPQDFIALVRRHGIAFHEKHKGQLFCDRSAEDLIAMLLAECADGRVERWQPCSVANVVFSPSCRRGEPASCYEINTDRGPVLATSLVIATGGLSIPKIGASDFGYRIAQQFGLPLVAQRPGLVPLTFDGEAWAPYWQLAGAGLAGGDQRAARREPGKAAPASTRTCCSRTAACRGRPCCKFPATGSRALPSPSTWPRAWTCRPRWPRPRRARRNASPTSWPRWCRRGWPTPGPARAADWQRPINEASDKALARLAEQLGRWALTPTGTEGYRKAEVTLGGVDTRALSQHSLQSKAQPGLYFIGEVVGITGWLGGYNFQWAWASAAACAQALPGAA